MLLLSMLAASVPAFLLYYPLINERNAIITTISIDAIQVSVVVLLVKFIIISSTSSHSLSHFGG